MLSIKSPGVSQMRLQEVSTQRSRERLRGYLDRDHEPVKNCASLRVRDLRVFRSRHSSKSCRNRLVRPRIVAQEFVKLTARRFDVAFSSAEKSVNKSRCRRKLKSGYDFKRSSVARWRSSLFFAGKNPEFLSRDNARLIFPMSRKQV